MQTNKHERSIILSALHTSEKFGLPSDIGYLQISKRRRTTLCKALRTGESKGLFVCTNKIEAFNLLQYKIRLSPSLSSYIPKETKRKLGRLQGSDKTLPDQLLKGLLLDYM